MPVAPVILLTACFENRGSEFADSSLSLSNRYAKAIVDAGGIPLVMPYTGSTRLVAEYVTMANGIMLTGGGDMLPKYFASDLSADLAQTLRVTEPERDELEVALVRETFLQRKALLCICRGHQVVNVALGGGMVVDISIELPNAMLHKDTEQGVNLMHEIDIEPGSRAERFFGANRVRVNSSHHQAVGRLADSLKATGKTADGIVEVLELKDSNELPFFFSVQFHPERNQTEQEGAGRIFSEFVQACR